MEQRPQSEFERRFDELTANPDGVESFKDDILRPDHFAEAFRKVAMNFWHTMELARHSVPMSTYEVESYRDSYLYDLQITHQYTWGEMRILLDDWIKEQIDQMDIEIAD